MVELTGLPKDEIWGLKERGGEVVPRSVIWGDRKVREGADGVLLSACRGSSKQCVLCSPCSWHTWVLWMREEGGL